MDTQWPERPWLWTNILGSNDCLTQADALGGVHVGWAWEFSIWVTGVESEDHTIWRFDGGSSDPNYWWLAQWLTPGLHTLKVNEWRNGAYVGWSAPFPFTVVADLTILGVCDNDPWGEGRGFWEAIAHCHEDVRVTRTPNWTIMAAGQAEVGHARRRIAHCRRGKPRERRDAAEAPCRVVALRDGPAILCDPGVPVPMPATRHR